MFIFQVFQHFLIVLILVHDFNTLISFIFNLMYICQRAFKNIIQCKVFFKQNTKYKVRVVDSNYDMWNEKCLFREF